MGTKSSTTLMLITGYEYEEVSFLYSFLHIFLFYFCHGYSGNGEDYD